MPATLRFKILKLSGERVPLAPDAAGRWRAELDRAIRLLEDARATSALPEEPAHLGELEDWLLDLRRGHWQ